MADVALFAFYMLWEIGLNSVEVLPTWAQGAWELTKLVFCCRIFLRDRSVTWYGRDPLSAVLSPI